MTLKEIGLLIVRKVFFYVQAELLIGMIMGASLIVLITTWGMLTWFQSMVFISAILFGAISYQMMYLNRISNMFGNLIKGLGLAGIASIKPETLAKETSNDNNTTNS